MAATGLCAESGAVRKGEPSSDNSVVLILRGDQPCGTGVLLSDRAVLTIRHVMSGKDGAQFGFTWAEDGRQPGSIKNEGRGRFTEARSSADIRMVDQTDGLTLALIDPKDRPKLKNFSFPKLVDAGNIPGSWKEKRSVSIVGYGRTGRESSGGVPAVAMRNFGTVTLAGGPPKATYFNTISGPTDQYARALDSGAPVFDGRRLLGITALIDGIPDLPLNAPPQPKRFSIHAWLGEPTIRRWIEQTLAQWSGR